MTTRIFQFYHPMADHVRLLQAFAICHKLDDLRQESPYPEPILLIGDLNSDPLSGAVRLLTNRSMLPNENDTWKHINNYRFDECGDSSYMIDHGYINVEEDSTESCAEEEFVDAKSSLGKRSTSISNESGTDEISDTDNSNTAIQLPAIQLPASFPILESGYHTIPQFTNYATDFVETLDYIFVSKPSTTDPFGFESKGEAPMPSEEMIKEHIAMPNDFMPSDHVSVVCDFEWVKRSGGYLIAQVGGNHTKQLDT